MRLRTLLQLLSGAALLGTLGCVNPEDLDQDGYSPRERDCDDANPSIYPGAKEIPGNTADENCNGQGDADLDGDGFSADGTLGGKPDCDDHRSNTYPGAPESPDGKSQDCDSIPDNHLPGFDDDNDGFSEANGDCNDANPAVFPAAADVENGVDDNCNGTVDEQSPSVDDDKDGLSETEGDCDDLNRTVFPGAPETGFQSGYDGDGLDNNCNGVIDEGTRFFDDDGDGFSENGAVGGRADCNDVNPAVFPGAAENFADGIDSDCDGSIEFDPADGPKPIEFDDGILSPGPSANVAGQYVDAPECKTLSQIISLQPFSPPRVYSLRFISVRDPSIPVSEVDEVGLIGYLIAQANAEFAPFGIQFHQEGVMEVVSSAEHASIENDHTAGIDGLHDAICEYVCGGCKAGPECDDPNGRIVVLLVQSMKSKFKDSNGNPVEIDAAGLGTYPASNYTGIGLDRGAINVRSGTAFAHELGHVFGLLHTHHYAENAALHERVDRTFAQCEMNGDGLCDTPADPHKFACSAVPGPACMPDCKGNADDQGGLWQPDVRNIMSYYHGCDHLNRFSTQQLQLMACVAQHSAHRKKLKVDGLSTCSVTCCDKESPLIADTPTSTECREKAAAACLDHFGTESIKSAGNNEFTSPLFSCTARCQTDEVMPVGNFSCAAGCIQAAKDICPDNAGSNTIRINYGGERVWCDTQGEPGGCWYHCNNNANWWFAPVGTMMQNGGTLDNGNECYDHAHAICGNSYDWATFCGQGSVE